MLHYPSQRREQKLRRSGFTVVAGLDEAGRGSWAGPLVAGAVILNLDTKIKGLADSKSLRAPVRQELFQKIIQQAAAWAVGIVASNDIDTLGLTAANILAMRLALKNLKVKPNYFLADGNIFKSETLDGENIINGDRNVASIAAASIVAKVTRDTMMDQLDEEFPQYGFKQHKGYGTNHHWQMLMEHGVCRIHRQSFEPIKNLVK